MQETITVAGESPTVDVKSNLQQTVMNQAILEGVPTGRDPWSLAKIIPGVQVNTYDVGGTQAMQQSTLRVHGSRDDDKNFAIDGTTVNWPGGGGGATMLYYDQGMFEEINYQTSAIPAEVMTGGIYLNMVTKSGSNRWRGDMKTFYARPELAERQLRRRDRGRAAGRHSRSRSCTTSTSPAAGRSCATGSGSTAPTATGASTS